MVGLRTCTSPWLALQCSRASEALYADRSRACPRAFISVVNRRSRRLCVEIKIAIFQTVWKRQRDE